MKLKTLLHFHCYTLITQLSPEEIKGRIETHVQPPPLLRWPRYKGSYMGTYADSRLQMIRSITYKNSLVIHGQISALNGKTEIKIKSRPDLFTLFRYVFYVITLGTVCLIALGNWMIHFDEKFQPKLLFLFGLLLFCIGLFYGIYGGTGYESRAFLTELLDAEEFIG